MAAEETENTDSDLLVFHHGDLDLKIIEAPKSRLIDEIFQFFTTFMISNVRTPLFSPATIMLNSTPVAQPISIVVSVAGVGVAYTRSLSWRSLVWNEHFKITLAHPVSQVKFEVRDKSVFGNILGTAIVSQEMISTSHELIDEWVPVITPIFGNNPPWSGAIHIQMKFTPCHKNPTYSNGVEGDQGLKESYFPLRHGGKVTLYQDAHVMDENMLPDIELHENIQYKHRNCWEDICQAILGAHHLVYLVGWSIKHKVKLVREPSKELPNGWDLNLGELLKYKSQNGVRVLLLLWDDSTGMMKTGGSATQEFFKDSLVSCVLVGREARNDEIIQQMVEGYLYSHHQKCVFVDTQVDSNNRKITAFLGGLDLTDGRYDTPGHRLFRDLDTVFQDDSNNPNFHKRVKCPRQPWHDLHCKIEGPAAYDVLENFEQRWTRATKLSVITKSLNHIKRLGKIDGLEAHDSLIKIEDVPIVNPSARIFQEDGPENWHVQVFLSLDSDSVEGFPKKTQEVDEKNLVIGKYSAIIDRSIQMAYIQAIRSAQHFVYIENQYFIGSSYAWATNNDAGADNLIPMELALKITSKIKAKERFAVYVVIPMWPEGDPSSQPVQEVLYWQRQTMQMMYEIIAKELKSAQVENAHPTDYLNFYCLGNREKPPADTIANDCEESASQRNGRFMIYVHSKGMIVDDEYVILGSANINQRSMAGSRDTEIAMGAYQPHYTCAKNMNHPRGQVYGYRMSLWAEHLGMIDDCFKEPKSLDCVKKVNNVADGNWKRYNAEEFTPLQGHILKYPIQVEDDGKINSLPGHETFPDVGGKILGSRTNLPTRLPSRLTT